MRYEGRYYITIDAADLGSVNFDEVMETSVDTVRKSVDGTKAILKFIPPQGQAYPPSIQTINSKSQRYNWESIIELVATPEWVLEDDLI